MEPQKPSVNKRKWLLPFYVIRAVLRSLWLQMRRIVVYTRAILEITADSINTFKQILVQRMFWGRGNLYKSSFHIIIAVFSSLLLLSGILNRIDAAQGRQEGLNLAYGAVSNNDLLLQGSSITSIFAIEEDEVNYRVIDYKVQPGDSLDKIAKKFNVKKDTIKWANNKILSPFNDHVEEGWRLKIPEMNGVLYEVRSGDTLEKVVAITKGNRFDIIELNELAGPKYRLKTGSFIFVPDGQLAGGTVQNPIRGVPGGGYVGSGVSANKGLGNLPAGSFDDPLTHPQCSGYSWNRGISASHTGVDLAKGGGCPIRAVAAGRVKVAGWWGGKAGYTVIIDHGGSVETHYYHGDGNIWVKVGDYVSKGQPIMYMGCSGNCNGTHLHLTLKYAGKLVDPAPYIPYRRP